MKSEAVFALENAGWPALLIDAGANICRANQAAVRMFGATLEGGAPQLSAIWSASNAASPDLFLAQWERSPAPLVPLKLRAKGGGEASHQVSICAYSRDGQKFFLLQIVAIPAQVPTGAVELKNPAPAPVPAADSALTHKQKLDCALQLARTVALDFNNALTAILGHSSLLLSQMEPDHPWRKSLLEVEKSAARAAEIANDLGTFSQQEKEARNQTDGSLNTLIQRSVETLKNEVGTAAVTWQLQLERSLFAARFDEAKMQQALLKVLENSVEALEDGGTITIQTRNMEIAEKTQDRNVQLVPGAYVCAEIADSGCGIDPEVLPRIFEPFFTTKRGNHRGLGLAWVYGIVTNHGGGVAVSSQVGAGTSVRIYLPAEKRVLKENGAVAGDLSGSETILIVDDEEMLLTIGRKILSSYGYKVMTANSGLRAIELLGDPKTFVDLVITDMVMPAMSGRELVEHIRVISPRMKILCTSGYVRPGMAARESNYLQKPFTSQELLLKVKQALAADPPS
jgi:signal transduction histidine kinase